MMPPVTAWAVRDQDDGLFARQRLDLRHDIIFAFYIDIGRGFIKDIDRAVMQQGAGQRQTLPLTARKIAAALVKLGVQPVFAAQKVRQPYLLQHGPQGGIVRRGRGHAQVVGHRAFEQVAAQADQRHVLQQGGVLDR